MTVLHFRKELIAPPAAVAVGEIAVRQMDVPDDVAAWLAMRRRAVAWLKPAVRAWTADDFATEMTGMPWWRADRTWIALVDGKASPLIGSVTLAMREGAAGSMPVVHWLLVDPVWRRRGVGRLLMEHLERAAWDAGWREVQLETHAGWSAAVAFYQSIGYAPLRDPPPR